ncbi:receptor-interacting serine/threonine-protein kinase 3 [Pelodytes ibericus]
MNKLKSVSYKSLEGLTIVGNGSFGSIYKARHKEWRIDVAVKKLHRGMSQSLEELLSEAQMMKAASDCSYVAHLFGILEDYPDGSQGIVMEYMERGCLQSLLNQHKDIGWALKFRIVYEVALGMNWLHNLSPPILHLDLKTTNVLLCAELHVKISDFGLSKFTHSLSACGNDSGYVGGTLEYLPPEAFKKDYQPDKSTDVYSFAILTYVVLTKSEPYPAAISRLIRIRIPEGDRPCIESLEEKESDVNCLNKAIELTRQCWHNDKLKRPTFGGKYCTTVGQSNMELFQVKKLLNCCTHWEDFYSANKAHILDAVTSLTRETSAVAAPEPSSKLSTANSSMSEVINRFKMDLNMEEPSVPHYAAPVVKKPVNSQKITNQPLPRTPYYMHRHIPTQPWMSGQRTYNPFQTAVGPIYINGNTDGIQIGNNNVMYVTNRPKQMNNGSGAERRGPTTQSRATTPKEAWSGHFSIVDPQPPTLNAARPDQKVQQCHTGQVRGQMSQDFHTQAPIAKSSMTQIYPPLVNSQNTSEPRKMSSLCRQNASVLENTELSENKPQNLEQSKQATCNPNSHQEKRQQ